MDSKAEVKKVEVRAYVALHPKESLAAVARHFGLSARKVQRWCGDLRKPPGVATAKRLPDAEELTPDAQAKVRVALTMRLDFLADPENLLSTRAKDIAITMGILADKWGGVMRATGADKDTTSGDAADLAQIARLERKYAAPTPLKLVEDG